MPPEFHRNRNLQVSIPCLIENRIRNEGRKERVISFGFMTQGSNAPISLSLSLSLSLSFSPKDLLLQLDELLPLLICSLALSSMLLHPPTDNHIPHARYRYLLSQSHSLSHTHRDHNSAISAYSML